MSTQEIIYLNDINYEDMDDLPLVDHFEWAYEQNGNNPIEDFGLLYWLDE